MSQKVINKNIDPRTEAEISMEKALTILRNGYLCDQQKRGRDITQKCHFSREKWHFFAKRKN